MGTCVRLEIPKAETLSDCIVFRAAGQLYALPKPQSVSFVDCPDGALRDVPGRSPVYPGMDGQEVFPVLALEPLLGQPGAGAGSGAGILMRVEGGSGVFGFLVPEVVGETKLKIDRRKSVKRAVLDDGVVFGYGLTDPVLVVLDIDYLTELFR